MWISILLNCFVIAAAASAIWAISSNKEKEFFRLRVTLPLGIGFVIFDLATCQCRYVDAVLLCRPFRDFVGIGLGYTLLVLGVVKFYVDHRGSRSSS